MSTYSLSLVLLLVALLGQAFASGLSIELFLRPQQAPWARRIWLALSIGALLLTLGHGHALELALRTGLYDLRQAVLGASSGLLFGLGFYGLRRRQP